MFGFKPLLGLEPMAPIRPQLLVSHANHACVCMCIYVCMYACMYVCICMYGCMDGWMCMYVCLFVCLFVYTNNISLSCIV